MGAASNDRLSAKFISAKCYVVIIYAYCKVKRGNFGHGGISGHLVDMRKASILPTDTSVASMCIVLAETTDQGVEHEEA